MTEGIAADIRYAEKFRCIGSDCEDTCCSGWQVSIDSATFQKYRMLPSSPLRLLMDERIHLNPSCAVDQDYARVKLEPDGRCAFLSAEQLCSIQLEHGEQALSFTCANYPRITRQIDDKRETSLQLSCPEAARIVLLDPHFLRPMGQDLSQHDLYEYFAAGASRLPPTTGNPCDYLWQVRQLIFLLLQDRSYSLWQRLFIVGMFCKRLASVGPGPRATPDLLRCYGEIMVQERLRDVLNAIPSRPEAQVALVMALLGGLSRVTQLPARFLECVTDCLECISAHDEPGAEFGKSVSPDYAPGYIAAFTQHFQPFFERNEYMLENYLLSYVVRQRFPYGDEAPSRATHLSPLMEFTLMALRFAMIKGVLIGMAGHYREGFNSGHVVKLIQSFAKSIEHSAAARAEMVDYIQSRKLDSSEGIAMMLRN
jgi:lysine-N-methylase